MRTVLALGGNAIAPGDGTSVDRQRERIREVAHRVGELDDRGHELLLTHGNGPQVGTQLLEQSRAEIRERPLDVLVAETQAQVGYLLAAELDGFVDDRVVTVVTRAGVDPEDPAFEDPSKPVGPYYSEEEAAEKPFETGPVTTSDGDRAYRRLVPSPEPQSLLEDDEIRRLAAGGSTVVCAGGGGVPVVTGDGIRGVEAVVDKDHTTSLVARAVDADCLAMVTDVDYAYVGFGTDSQRPIREADRETMRTYLRDGEFAEGSMKPKVEACLSYLDDGGARAVVTSPEDLVAAIEGESGTQVVP